MAVQRPDYPEAIERLGVLETLARFDPRVAGTLPLGIAMPDSDIDIICHAPDAESFASAIWSAFSGERGFAMRQWIGKERAVIASFVAHGWAFELFGQALPVCEQAGWRHFDVERRLLELGGARLREAVMLVRHGGVKTEPAFARILGLDGDPYDALLGLAACSDRGLVEVLARAGFGDAAAGGLAGCGGRPAS